MVIVGMLAQDDDLLAFDSSDAQPIRATAAMIGVIARMGMSPIHGDSLRVEWLPASTSSSAADTPPLVIASTPDHELVLSEVPVT